MEAPFRVPTGVLSTLPWFGSFFQSPHQRWSELPSVHQVVLWDRLSNPPGLSSHRGFCPALALLPLVFNVLNFLSSLKSNYIKVVILPVYKTCMCAGVCVAACGGQRVTSGTFLSGFPPYI